MDQLIMSCYNGTERELPNLLRSIPGLSNVTGFWLLKFIPILISLKEDGTHNNVIMSKNYFESRGKLLVDLARKKEKSSFGTFPSIRKQLDYYDSSEEEDFITFQQQPLESTCREENELCERVELVLSPSKRQRVNNLSKGNGEINLTLNENADDDAVLDNETIIPISEETIPDDLRLGDKHPLLDPCNCKLKKYKDKMNQPD